MEESTGELDSRTKWQKKTEQKEKGRQIKARECKRIEESNRHSNYRRRNGELMTKYGKRRTNEEEDGSKRVLV